MAKLTKDVFGVANGEVYPRTFAAGEDCPPELESAAAVAEALETTEQAEAREKAEAAAAAEASKAAAKAEKASGTQA